MEIGFRLSWFAAGLVVLELVFAMGCGRKITVTQEQVEQRIHQEIPLGSTRDEVVTFLESLSINGLRAEHYGYIAGKPSGTDGLPEKLHLVEGYVGAVMRKVAQSPLQVYRIEMTFYFGEEERLIAYRLRTLGDW
jgi:hypothetical protein